jgi:hypothetical protein
MMFSIQFEFLTIFLLLLAFNFTQYIKIEHLDCVERAHPPLVLGFSYGLRLIIFHDDFNLV